VAVPEVGHLRVARGGEQHVLGLYVAVDYAARVRDREGLGHPRRHPRGLAGVEGTLPFYPLRERAARYVLHGYVVGAVFGLALVVDLDDAGVVERRRVLGLAPEALDEPLVVRVLPPEDLERHVPAQDLVPGQVNLGHPPAADGLAEDVAAVDEVSLHGSHGNIAARGVRDCAFLPIFLRLAFLC
jgi:hypothetical protein